VKSLYKPEYGNILNEETYKEYVERAEVMLGARKGHIAIINYLRKQGMTPDQAKKMSYPIFDEAKASLMVSQNLFRFVAWFLIIMGIVAPIVMVIRGAGFVIVSGAPLILGGLLLNYLIVPSRLPE